MSKPHQPFQCNKEPSAKSYGMPVSLWANVQDRKSNVHQCNFQVWWWSYRLNTKWMLKSMMMMVIMDMALMVAVLLMVVVWMKIIWNTAFIFCRKKVKLCTSQSFTVLSRKLMPSSWRPIISITWQMVWVDHASPGLISSPYTKILLIITAM